MSDLGAVLYVLDLDRAVAFYIATAGWKVIEEQPGFVALQSPSANAPTILTLVRIPDEHAADISITNPPERREDTPIKLSFAVDELANVRSQASRHGGVVDPIETEWTFGSVRVCDGHDPEGNVVQFRQSI